MLRREGETHNRRKNRRLSLASSFFFSCFFLRNFIVMRFDFARTCAPDLLTLHDDSRFSINRDIGLHSWQWYTHAESTGRHENRVSQRLSENQADCLYLYTSRHSAETVSSGASPTSRARVPNKKKHASKTHDFTLFVNRLQTIFFFFFLNSLNTVSHASEIIAGSKEGGDRTKRVLARWRTLRSAAP